MTTETEPIRLDGKATAKQMRAETALGCAAFTEKHGQPPGLTVLRMPNVIFRSCSSMNRKSRGFLGMALLS